MAKPVFLLSLEPNSGKSLVSLGVLESAAGHVDRIGYFRPVVAAGDAPDALIETVRRTYRLQQEYSESFGATTDQTRGMGESVPAWLVHQILARYEALADRCDLVVIEGTDYTGASAAFEFALNAELASHMGATTVLVEPAHEHTVEQVRGAISAGITSLADRNIAVAAVIINRVAPDIWDEMQQLARSVDEYPVRLIPSDPSLSRPSLREVAEATGASLLLGSPEDLGREITTTKVAAMTLPHFLERLETGSLVIVPGDRADVFLAAMATPFAASGFPTVAGMLLTGGLHPRRRGAAVRQVPARTARARAGDRPGHVRDGLARGPGARPAGTRRRPAHRQGPAHLRGRNRHHGVVDLARHHALDHRHPADVRAAPGGGRKGAQAPHRAPGG